MIADLRHATRLLYKSPGFAAVAIVTLAVGIGANTAIFSFFRAILLRPLPYHEPERVVVLKKHAHDYGEPVGVEIGLLAADYRELVPQTRTLADTATYTLDSATLTGRGPAALVVATIVTPNFFSLLGTPASLGRVFSVNDTHEGRSGRLATVAYDYWQTRLGGSPEIIGQTLVLNQIPFTVVGIMPPDFEFPRETQVWVTPETDVPETSIGFFDDVRGRGNYLRTILGRLAPGVTWQQAQDELTRLVATLPNPNRVHRLVRLVNMRDQSVGEVRPALAILLACVGTVLLIACLNVANLVLSRATVRERELAIRIGLGASRWRIGWHLASESILLSLAGGALGLLLSLWTLDLLVAVAPDELPRLGSVRIDAGVLTFTVAISLLTGLLSGVAPLLGLPKLNPAASINAGDGNRLSRPASPRLRTFLVGSEIALSLLLLVAAGLLLRSLLKMQAFSWGFDPGRIVSARLVFTGDRHAEHHARTAFARALLDKLEHLPGFQSVGLSLDRIGHSWIQLPFTAHGHVYAEPSDRPLANYHIVSRGYLRTLGIPLLRGRHFTADDDLQHPLVAIVDATLARTYFPDGDAVGRTMAVPDSDREAQVQIIGIVGSVASDGPLNSSRPDIYIPNLQVPLNSFFVHVRTSLDLATATGMIRRAVESLDSEIPVTDAATMQQVLARPAAARRFVLLLVGAFATVAVFLAVVGIYAVTAFHVAQRTREIGVRMALGARTGAVVRLVLRQGLRPVLFGLIAGVAGAVATAFVMRRVLFDVAPLDAPTFALLPLALAGISAAACLLPARRAARIDPIEALRTE